MTQDQFMSLYQAMFRHQIEQYFNQSAISRDVSSDLVAHHETYMFGLLVGMVAMSIVFGKDLKLDTTSIEQDLSFIIENFPKDTQSLIKVLEEAGYLGETNDAESTNPESVGHEESTVGLSEEGTR